MELHKPSDWNHPGDAPSTRQPLEAVQLVAYYSFVPERWCVPRW